MTVLYFLLATIALGILVLVHEAGHFLAARWMGMTVESFSIGFGSAIWKRRIHGVEWRVGWIPFGGYVRIKGMDTGLDKDKKSSGSVYDIPGGFYSKSPLKRIFVLVAGPMANIFLAFSVFSFLWLLGGRNKDFSEFTKVVGWVNPASSLASQGLMPGDRILTCNGSEYVGVKDCISASLLEGKWDLSIERPGYSNEETKLFSLQARCPEEEKGLLPVAGASYLVFGKKAGEEDKSKLLLKGSPLENSPLLVGDRLLWIDGELLFSHFQLSRILNQEYAFLKVRRGDKEIFVRSPRVSAGSLQMSTYVRNELIDSQYEIGLKGKWKSLKVLPYVINAHCYVEGKLFPIDPQTSLSGEDNSLEVGDKIIAVDGVPVSRNYDLLKLLQEHKVTLIVENLSLEERTKNSSVAQADELFVTSFNMDSMRPLIGSIGTADLLTENGQMRLITGIQPLKRERLLPKEFFDKQYAWAAKIKDKNKKSLFLERIEQEKNRLSLGIHLEDMSVRYNPDPIVLSSNVVSDSLKTLKALFLGRLGPKWLSGPIGIIQVLHTGWSLGIGEALFWIGLISMNLAVLNLMPIPALDGGYILISIWELVKRKRLNIRLLEKLLFPFIIFLIFFFLFLTFQDVSRIFWG
ncbi:site-2 protease family protein [Chlamydiifrater phoenicopteri]|uniref:site-2 protease family protein n=1 Tax=Chlamydiifrater phoenicopteri TaxID=2681469 RepID=UPI001BCB60AE|nr:site-2 protease family protein [Chlamydiifrater phoenicopteri]